MNSTYICYCMAQGRRKWMFVWESEKVLEPWGLSSKEVMGFSAHGKEWDTEGRADSLIFQAGCRHVGGRTAGEDGVLLFLCFYCVSPCLLTHKRWFPPALWLTPPFKSSYCLPHTSTEGLWDVAACTGLTRMNIQAPLGSLCELSWNGADM